MTRGPMYVRRFRLGEEPDEVDLGGPTTLDERLTLVWTLTRECWALGPRDMPTYRRADAPIVRRKLGDAHAAV